MEHVTRVNSYHTLNTVEWTQNTLRFVLKYCTLCILYTAYTAHRVYRTLSIPLTVYTAQWVYCTLCILHTVYTAHYVYRSLCILHTVYTTHCVYCTPCIPHTMYIAHCVYCTLCILQYHAHATHECCGIVMFCCVWRGQTGTVGPVLIKITHPSEDDRERSATFAFPVYANIKQVSCLRSSALRNAGILFANHIPCCDGLANVEHKIYTFINWKNVPE